MFILHAINVRVKQEVKSDKISAQLAQLIQLMCVKVCFLQKKTSTQLGIPKVNKTLQGI